MSTNYEQKCMVGIKFSVEKITHVVSEAIYEDQIRYDSRTGKVTGTEKVLVKRAELKYVFHGEGDDWRTLAESFADELGLDFFAEDDYFYIGEFVGDEYGMGNIDLLTGSFAISDIVGLFAKVKAHIMGDVKLHFLTSVG